MLADKAEAAEDHARVMRPAPIPSLETVAAVRLCQSLTEPKHSTDYSRIILKRSRNKYIENNFF